MELVDTMGAFSAAFGEIISYAAKKRNDIPELQK